MYGGQLEATLEIQFPATQQDSRAVQSRMNNGMETHHLLLGEGVRLLECGRRGLQSPSGSGAMQIEGGGRGIPIDRVSGHWTPV